MTSRTPAPEHAPAEGYERPVVLPDVLQFMQVLWGVVHGLDRVSKRMAGEAGVTGPQRLVLRVVGLSPGMSAGHLAAVLHVHPSTLTGVIQRLVAQGLLVRAHDPRDRRRAVLHLTPQGARVNALRRGTVESAIATALQGVSRRDRAVTRRVLERLTVHLEPVPARQDRRARPRVGTKASRTVTSHLPRSLP